MMNSKLLYLNYMSFANFLQTWNCFTYIYKTYGYILKGNNINNSSTIIVINANNQQRRLIKEVHKYRNLAK